MRPATLLSVLLIVLVLLAAAGGALLMRGTGSAEPLEALPADASIVIHTRSLPRLIESLGSSRLSEGSGDDDGRWEMLAEALQPLLGMERLSASLTPDVMAWWLGGDVALAQVPGRTDEPPAFVLVSSAPGSSERAAREAMRLLGSAGGEPEGWVPRTHRGVPYSLLRVGEGSGTVCVTAARGIVLITTSARAMRRVLDALDGRERSVARDPDWLIARNNLPRRADLYVHVSEKTLRAWLRAHAEDPSFTRLAALAGAGAARHAALALRIREGLFQESLFVVLSPEKRGLPGALFKGRPRAEAGAVPRDPRFTVNASIAWEDPSGAWREVPRTLAAENEKQLQDLEGRLGGLEDFLGLELQGDLLGSLGRDLRISVDAAGPFPRVAAPHSFRNLHWRATMELRRPDPIRRMLKRVDGLARVFATREAEGRDDRAITWYRIPALAPMTPAYRLTRRTLDMASSPELLASPPATGPSARGSLRNLPERAHLFFRISTRYLAELGIGWNGRPLRQWPAPALLSLAEDEDLPLTVGAGRMETSGFLLEWVSPVSMPGIAWAAWRQHGAAPVEPERSPAATDIEDPLY
ncbi:MAG: hypothetical protein ACREAA_05355 [Candidatus Polarisedimenticolia bacterium]